MPKHKKSAPQLLTDFLEQHTVPELKQLALLIASHLPTRKADVIKVISAYMSNPDNLRQLWKQLDTTQQAAISEVVHSNSAVFDAEQFKAKYGKSPYWGKFGYGWANKDAPSRLRLFFYSRYRQGGQMPLDLKEQMQDIAPPPRAVKILTLKKLPETIPQSFHVFNRATRSYLKRNVATPLVQLETERAALQDFQALLRLVEAGKVRVSKTTYRVSAAGAKVITPILSGGDFYLPGEILDDYDKKPVGPIKAFAWPLILQSAGLAELTGTRLKLTPAGKKALNAPPEKGIRSAWKKWLKTTIIDEFSRIHAIKGQGGKGKHTLSAPSRRRAVIANALAECPPNEWIEFDEFSRYMQAAGHIFEVARDLWKLYIGDSHYGSLGYEGYGEWHVVQARYLLAFLFEYAAVMGLIDIAYIPPLKARVDYGDLWGADDLDCLSRYDGLLYIRLNNLGTWVLGLAPKYIPSPIEERKILKTLPNLDVTALGPLPPHDRLFLEQFAAPIADKVWKIDRKMLLKAVEGGQKIADIQKFLQAKSGHKLPNPVAVLLKETAERVASLSNRGEAWLIEAKDPPLAQIIAHDSQLRSLCMPAGERFIVVPKENKAEFRRKLRQLGYGVSP